MPYKELIFRLPDIAYNELTFRLPDIALQSVNLEVT